MDRITQGSFSRLKDYETCPQKAKFKHVLKMKEPPNEAMDRGSAIHKLSEDFSKAKPKAKAPLELKAFEKQFRNLQKQRLTTEEKWAVNRAWEPVGFFDRDVFWRFVLDCAYVAEGVIHIIDYKTGRQYDDHKIQLQDYALAAFCHYPTLEHTQEAMWYLDHGTVLETSHEITQLKDLKDSLLSRSKAMFADKRFAPLPGRHCSWCSFSKAKGGPCEF